MLITKTIYTETGHRLTNYQGNCAHFHGHSYKWEVTVKGFNNNNGMVIDFKDLKQILKDTIEILDHAFVMHDKDPILKITGEQELVQLFKATDGSDPRLFIVPFNPTVENLVKWQTDLIKPLLPEAVLLHSIRCFETATSSCEVILL